MRYVKWTFLALIALLVFGFLHYTLPQRDIVRIVNTEVRRVDFGENSIFWAAPDVGTASTTTNRDVRFIEAIRPNGKPIVYRNEDTGWGWPPYFKLDSSNLQAEARDLVSTKEAPQWVAVRHYGWRNEFLTIYPNAVGVKPVDGPEVRLIPVLNIFILTLLVALLAFLWRVWAQFRERTIDPLLEDAEETWDAVDERADAARDKARGLWGRLMGWLGKRRR
ncbi:DUF1523 family protein [Actibacterium sp.]|uniref:DUF1523 family protein n=1 Tax=Actibacterium sp. TaxID=1872125 RepID=UPI003567A8F2